MARSMGRADWHIVKKRKSGSQKTLQSDVFAEMSTQARFHPVQCIPGPLGGQDKSRQEVAPRPVTPEMLARERCKREPALPMPQNIARKTDI